MHVFIEKLAIRRVGIRSEIHSNESGHLVKGTKVARLWRRFCFVLQQAISSRTRNHLYRQGLALAGTRQLRSQGSMSVHAYCIEGVTRSKIRKGANGDGNRIGIGNVDGNGDGTGAERERERGWRLENERKTRTATGAEKGRERKLRKIREDEVKRRTGTGAGHETRAVVKTGIRTKTETGAGTGAGSGKGTMISAASGNK